MQSSSEPVPPPYPVTCDMLRPTQAAPGIPSRTGSRWTVGRDPSALCLPRPSVRLSVRPSNTRPDRDDRTNQSGQVDKPGHLRRGGQVGRSVGPGSSADIVYRSIAEPATCPPCDSRMSVKPVRVSAASGQQVRPRAGRPAHSPAPSGAQRWEVAVVTTAPCRRRSWLPGR